MNSISNRILRLVEDQNLSYGALSALTGIPKTALYRYATGETDKIPLDRLELIANALHVTPAYLMGWETEVQKPENTSLENKNVVRIAGRDGSFIEKNLSDDQVAALKTLIDQLPEADDL